MQRLILKNHCGVISSDNVKCRDVVIIDYCTDGSMHRNLEIVQKAFY